MRDLIGRLEVVDDDTASALRVIDHFDLLVEQRASTAAVMRALAAMAGCPAGLHDAGRGPNRRYAPDGRALTDEVSHLWTQVAATDQSDPWLWLERTGPAGPLDALMLERAARALQALGGASVHRSVDGLVKTVCDRDASEEDRRDAVARLSLTGPVTVVVSASAHVQTELSAALGTDVVGLLCGSRVIPQDIRAGVAVAKDPMELPTALEQACVALQVADGVDGVAPSVVRYDELGVLAAIIERFSPNEAAALDDVRRIDNLLADHPWVFETLQAILDRPSLRQAAGMLHVHHSTLQERLTWLTTKLGYSPVRSRGRQRAAVAVLLWRVAHGADAARRASTVSPSDSR